MSLRKQDVAKICKNPSIRLSSKFFKSALRDYQNWKEKWWREVIQNSVDAGSSVIECYVEEDTETKIVKVSCVDNGKGMTEEVLLHKFLVLGETTKTADSGTVGGFGKAKELLILPWLSWEIQSRKVLVRGEGSEYEVEEASEYLDGTRITVYMSPDYDSHTTDLAAKSFIRKCYIPHVAFYVNGDRVIADLEGKHVKDLEGLEVYWNEEFEISGSQRILIRTNGVYMFSDYNDKIEGAVIVEVKGPSIEAFTANRESFRDPDLRWAYRNFANTLVKDVRSGLRGAGHRLRKKYSSNRKFSSYELEDSADDIAKLVREKGFKKTSRPDVDVAFGKDAVTTIAIELEYKDKVSYSPYQDEPKKDKVLVPVRGLKLIEALIEGVGVRGESHVENAIQQLMWEPDFYLVNEIKDYKIPKKFMPETMNKSNIKLARFWAELCRFVLIQLGSSKKFGVGFIFSHEVNYRGDESYIQAEYIREDGEDWIMLNPFKDGDTSGRTYNLSNEDDIDQLYALAIHECTHISDGIAYHDEDFAGAITRNMGKAIRGRKNLRAIKNAISKNVKK